jgi:hypothetical protein
MNGVRKLSQKTAQFKPKIWNYGILALGNFKKIRETG